MTPLFKKLNLGAQNPIHVVGAPDTFDGELRALEGVHVVREIKGEVTFALVFVKTLQGLERASTRLVQAAEGDALLWMVYPKTSSKKYQCEFNRDTGWQALGDAGYEPVRQVAIDEDWSALRFRKAEFIKTMRRNPDGAISAAGRQKAQAPRDARPWRKPGPGT
jgi:hypothetical protein